MEACKKLPDYTGRVSSKTEISLEPGDQKAFLSLLNKFAHVLDTRKGGETVSAIGVIAEFDGLRYFIGSNARKASERAALEAFFRELLEMNGDTDPSPQITQTAQFLRVLKHIVAFNKPRICRYTKILREKQRVCLRLLDGSKTEYSQGFQHLRTTLTSLQDLISSNSVQGVEGNDVDASVELIRLLDRSAGRGAVADAISELCGESRYNPAPDWLELRHMIARLRAYHVSAETIVACQRQWPELFEDFRVTIVSSSKPDANPFKTQKLSVHGALGRFTSDKEKLQKWRKDAEWLEKFDLDSIYKDACSKDTFRPQVHAEVLVYNEIRMYLEDNPGIEYWQNWRYIGSSKPTCRLCHYYFQVMDDNVSVRETHNNLYPTWRLPDCYDDDSAKKREELMNMITKRTRQDAVRVIQNKLPRGTRNDSSSYPAVASWLQYEDRGTSSIHELSEAFNHVSLVNRDNSKKPRASFRIQQAREISSQSLTPWEADEDADGGVSLV